MLQTAKPKASLSLDLDNAWSYMKTHGDAGWEAFPSYLDVVVPRVNAILDRIGPAEGGHSKAVKITYFIVGQDAALEKNHAALSAITAAGHEVGNHSFHHEPWLHLYSPAEIDREIGAAEDAIEQATGARPKGFRGPGFSVSQAVLETLAARGYAYDASTFPTFIGPLARAYYFFNATLPAAERKKRARLFGTLAEGLRRLEPYEWQLDGRALLELPVTTMPLTRMPFHLSYLIFLAARSPLAAEQYFATALKLCRARGVPPSLLLHPLDFLGSEDAPQLGFFPGMNMASERKLALVEPWLARYAREFDVMPMGAFADWVRRERRLTRRAPDFAAAEPEAA
jgi:peptidoglycan-N-acetylglucosamine deacetylase